MTSDAAKPQVLLLKDNFERPLSRPFLGLAINSTLSRYNENLQTSSRLTLMYICKTIKNVLIATHDCEANYTNFLKTTTNSVTSSRSV